MRVETQKQNSTVKKNIKVNGRLRIKSSPLPPHIRFSLDFYQCVSNLSVVTVFTSVSIRHSCREVL